MSHDLSPLKVVLPAGIWLRRRLRQGYNLTLISGTRDMLLFGLLGLEFNPWDLPLKKGRCYSALLIATKDGRFVSCSSEFLPLGEFGGVDRQPDSLRDHFSEDGTARTVDMMYGKDRMSIWMPLTEQSIFSPLNVPQPVFRSVCRNTYQKIFYSHLQDADSSIRGPLSHAEAHYKLPWHISQEPTFTIDVLSTDNKRTSSNRTTSYHIEPPIDKS
ncbi:hypothetical protein M409DRAFT_31193 [Zasmidium cellare ATCC 36951]|uniref:Uncharacterized protein n=1 Tax=Zasmidium cellare ATCC 36951 TaxID=1080233 RepID=A0A6A6BUW1_ZASCE|nr:uncharacterized protein M409DRAFT_31193 [Zasmidium cellare ATCC 36951]KAF2158293.1 hypothetical protein M409DRAFT_31193 [Zasmidium cellare ATCC 36951]